MLCLLMVQGLLFKRCGFKLEMCFGNLWTSLGTGSSKTELPRTYADSNSDVLSTWNGEASVSLLSAFLRVRMTPSIFQKLKRSIGQSKCVS